MGSVAAAAVLSADHKTIPPEAASEVAPNTPTTGIETTSVESVNGGISSISRSSDLGVKLAPTSEKEAGGAARVRLVVGVLTAGGHADRRQAVRDTWGSDPRYA